MTLGWSTAATAGTLTVTKLTDSNDGSCDADCSLREAIIAANSSPGLDTVSLGAGIHLLSLPGVDENAALTGDLDISDDLVIEGLGADLTAVDADGIDRVFHILEGPTVTFMGIAVQGGRTVASGAGVINFGELTIVNSEVRNNETIANGFGGGIYSDVSSLVVDRSTIANNTAIGGGGGIAAGTDLTVLNSTVSGNVSTMDFGGGFYVFSLTDVTLNNVTVYNNEAEEFAGGIFFEGGVTSTISNTVLASNRIGATFVDCNGTFGSIGYNFVSAATCSGFTATGDLTGTTAAPLDPGLGPLLLNEGTTASHSPQAGSSLIDTGSPAIPVTGGDACNAVDQRSFARPIDGNGNSTATCDIGSIEAGAGPTIFADGFEAGNTSAWSTVVAP